MGTFKAAKRTEKLSYTVNRKEIFFKERKRKERKK